MLFCVSYMHVFCNCTFPAQLSMFDMERRSRNMLTIIIIIIRNFITHAIEKKRIIFSRHVRERERGWGGMGGGGGGERGERGGENGAQREREREGWGGWRERKRRGGNKYNGLKDQSNAQSFVDNHMVSSAWQQCVKWRWYSSDGCEPAQVCLSS